MIYTLTLNPCLDRTLYFEGTFRVGELNRASSSITDAGGKGINVSRVLTRLGKQNTAFLLAGGETGKKLISLLKKEGVSIRASQTSCETRICTKMIDAEGNNTEANEAGGPVTETELHSLMSCLLDTVRRGDTVSICGSVPRGVTKDIYRTLTAELKNRGVYVAADCDGEALQQAASAAADLIKPNAYELSLLTGKKIPEKDRFKAEEAAVSAARQYGISVLCTLGAEGALWTDGKNVSFAPAHRVTARSFTGAGDTFLAAFISRKDVTDIPSALAFASAAAAAKVQLPGTAVPSLAEIDEIL